MTLPKVTTDPEAGHHLVADEQSSVGVCDGSEPFVEAGVGRHDTHVGGRGLGDHRGDLGTVLVERRPHRIEVVVGHDDRVCGLRPGDTRTVRERERRDPGTGRG